MSEPGLVLALSRIYQPDQLTEVLFDRWYDEVHIRDLLATGAIKTGIRWKAIDPNEKQPYLTIYPLDRIDALQTDAVRAVPVHSNILPGPSRYIWDFVAYDARIYKHIQTYEPEGTKAGPANLLLAVGLTPAPGTDDDFNAFYREEHIKLICKTTGYRRTRRYKLQKDLPQPSPEVSPAPPPKPANPPVYLLLHEFDGEMVPQRELIKANETEWARRVAKGLVKMEVVAVKLWKAFGDEEKRF